MIKFSDVDINLQLDDEKYKLCDFILFKFILFKFILWEFIDFFINFLVINRSQFYPFFKSVILGTTLIYLFFKGVYKKNFNIKL